MPSKGPLDLERDVDAVNMTASSPGGTYTVLGDENGYDLYAAASFAVSITAHQAPGGSNPTCDVRVQHSADREHWATLADLTQITTGPGTFVTVFPTAAVPSFARYVRLQYKVGGTTPDWTITGVVQGKE